MNAIVEQDPELHCIKCKRPWTEVVICCDQRSIEHNVRHVDGVCIECDAPFHAAQKAIDSLGDAHPHRRIAKDLHIEAAKLAMFDELVNVLETIADGFRHTDDQFSRSLFELVVKCKALQGGAK